MRLLVCGGRDYGYKEDDGVLVEDPWVWSYALSEITKINPSVVIQGGARGADFIAKCWASSRPYVEMEEYKANWDLYGKGAGYRRNAEMLKEGKPDKVLAFKGGKGTLMMIGLAEKAGVEVVKHGWDD